MLLYLLKNNEEWGICHGKMSYVRILVGKLKVTLLFFPNIKRRFGGKTHGFPVSSSPDPNHWGL